MNLITLQTKHTTYQIGINEFGIPLHLYYGETIDGDMSYLLTYYDRGFSGNLYDTGADRTISNDALPQEYPCYGNGDYRSPAFNIRRKNGVYGIDLRYKSHKMYPGKYGIPGLPAVYAKENEAQTLEILLEDESTGIQVILKYGILPELDVITRCVSVKNAGTECIYMDKVLSASLDFLGGDYELLHFYGRHNMERNLERIPVIHGRQHIGSRRGASSHQHNPFVVAAKKGTTEDHGGCYGMSLLYSGNFTFEIEKDQYDQIRMQMGISDEMFEYPLHPGECFDSPEVAMVYSADGLSVLSHRYHQLIREHVCRGKYQKIRRPVLINNWEATYFDFTGEKIISIAKQAAELGVEMMVLDDGWFGKRDSDNSGLGDWHVNEEKLGGTLSEIVTEINAMGMKFGLWIEPEMINENSNLYRQHPEWVFTIPGKKPIRSRNQLVLDFSRKEIVDGIFDQITAVLDAANVEYLKLDMNRSICDVYTAAEGYQNYGKILYEYVKGVYSFLERLHQRYPEMLIESCSGGGGRFDAGMLYYSPQIWCSDNTDAIERIHIQHGTSFGYPISAVGSHVSAVPNHQTGRKTDIETRSIVAMAGSFGYELDLNQISEEEKNAVKRQIEEYKGYWPLLHEGKYYRLTNPAENHEVAAWMFVSKDQKEALLNIVSLNVHGNAPVSYVQCRGLDKKASYVCEKAANCYYENQVYSGNGLMCAGLPVPGELGEYGAMQMKLTKIEE